jgi:signal transduction histidine kinase
MSTPLRFRIASLPLGRQLPRRTARLRLAVLYGCGFLACGAVLLAITYLLVSQNAGFTVQEPGAPGSVHSGATRDGLPRRNFAAVAHVQRATDLHTLLIMSVITLAVMAVASGVLGWLIAGRVLQPLRTITNTAREISATNLHRRLALAGPDDELKELGDTLDGLLGRLEVAFESQRRFVANASHELRTPLARLKTMLQVSLMDPDATPASLRLAQQRALASERQLERLIDALLTLASGEQALQHREPIDLAAATSTLLRARAQEIERRKLRVDAKLEPAWTEGDPLLLERLIANLLDNAIEHNTPGGWLNIALATPAASVMLSVINGGPVIPADELDRLGQPFQQLAAERTNGGDGHGLGLSIVAAITTSHGGTLRLHARADGGLQAQVELPKAPAVSAP